MEVADELGALEAGVPLVVTSAEHAFALGALDAILTPWIRERLARLTDLARGADGLQEFARDVRNVARAAAEYSVLREQLHADLSGASDGQPPWRVAEKNALTVRAPSQRHHPGPIFALHRPLARIFTKQSTLWTFTVIPPPADRHALSASYEVETTAETPSQTIYVTAPPALSSDRAAYQQLEYAFQSLGRRPFLR
jgi:hypothetical protein